MKRLGCISEGNINYIENQPICKENGFQRRLRCFKSGYRCLGRLELLLEFYQKGPGMVKLVMALYHVSQRDDQGEFQDGRALPYESWW